MLIKTIAAITFGVACCAGAAASDSAIEIDRGGMLKGRLALPDAAASMPAPVPSPVPVVLLVAGDADADPASAGNNSLRKLAQALAAQGIASVRYSARGGATPAARDAAAPIDRNADDAAAWITLLKRDSRFNKVVVVGYGDGMLPGLLAANKVGANGFVSLAGAGQRSPAAQQYDPAAEFGKLNMHARIIYGGSDRQVSPDDARRLEHGRPGTPVVLIAGMDHALTVAPGAPAQADLPVAPELVTALAGFVGKR